jgi:RNA polymerase sigma factor FliA
VEGGARGADPTKAAILRLDQPVDDPSGEPSSLADLVQELHQDALPEEALERTELLGSLREAMAQLPEPQRTVVDRYYVRGDLLRDIAADHGITEARVSQICLEAVHALRAFLSVIFDGVPEVPAGAPGHRRRAAYLAHMAETSTWRSRMAAAGA